MAEYRSRKQLEGMTLHVHETRPMSVISGGAVLMVMIGEPSKPTTHVGLTPSQARDLSRALWEEAEALEAWAEQEQAGIEKAAGTH